MHNLKFLLLPFAILYGTGVRLRNFLYNTGFLKSTSFSIPLILTGNLTTGGTGKTPCVEYLVRLIKNDFRTAVLSRGYKRKSKGFIIGSEVSTAKDIGDEPLQIASKFPDILMAVDRRRVNGVKKLLCISEPPECIILDDGFQHRSLKPGLSIILTEYNNIYFNDFLLPAGKLREHRHNSKRADIIIITKSPAVHSPIAEKLIIKKLKPKKSQLVFFSWLEFGEPIAANPAPWPDTNPNTIVLFTGIASPSLLEQHLAPQCSNLITIKYPDHHYYSEKDFAGILKTYNDQFTKNKILVTTEKDFYRLKHEQGFNDFKNIPLFFIPVNMRFHPHVKAIEFDKIILDYIKTKNYSNPLNTA